MFPLNILPLPTISVIPASRTALARLSHEPLEEDLALVRLAGQHGATIAVAQLVLIGCPCGCEQGRGH